MKISFDDYSYIEIIINQNNKVQITLGARDKNNSKSQIINSVEISKDEFSNFVRDIFK